MILKKILFCQKGENIMKKFETPEIKIEKIEVMDVITTSTCELEAENCDFDTGMG